MDEEARMLPGSDLDLQLMVTDSVWGRNEVSPELKNKLKRLNPEGQISTDKESLWGLLGFFTRDMRLGNLSSWDGELQIARYMIDLANDFLDADMIEPFIISLSRSACILETSQSKGGFLRKAMNTLRQEHYSKQEEPTKKGFFGGSKNNQQQGGM